MVPCASIREACGAGPVGQAWFTRRGAARRAAVR